MLRAVPDDAEDARRAFAARLAEALAGRTQEWLAHRMDVDQTTVSSWLRAETFPRRDRVRLLEDVLEIPPGELFAIIAGAPPPPPPPGRDETLRRLGEVRDAVGLIMKAVDALERSVRGWR